MGLTRRFWMETWFFQVIFQGSKNFLKAIGHFEVIDILISYYALEML
jgi:hypothetical protein